MMLLTLPGAALCSIPIGVLVQKRYAPWISVTFEEVLVSMMVLLPVSAFSSFFALRADGDARSHGWVSRFLTLFNVLVFLSAGTICFFSAVYLGTLWLFS